MCCVVLQRFVRIASLLRRSDIGLLLNGAIMEAASVVHIQLHNLENSFKPALCCPVRTSAVPFHVCAIMSTVLVVHVKLRKLENSFKPALYRPVRTSTVPLHFLPPPTAIVLRSSVAVTRRT